jgi:tetratricopeptide (TPR) repeat protein
MLAHGMSRLRILAAGLATAMLLASFAVPAGASQPTPEIERKDPGVMMGERAFRRFDTLTQLYSDGKYQEALSSAQAFLRQDHLNAYERAMGEQMMGFVLISLDRMNEAIPRFERAIELDSLPNNAHFNMMRSLAQLYSSREEWQRSIDMMTEYLRYQPQPSPEDQIIMAQNYAQMQRYRDALPWVRGAIRDAGDKAQESWYQLELAIHFETRDFRAALQVLNTIVARWPDQLRYWEMMSGAHQELNQDVDAVAALMAAYNGGLITEERKILNLVRMNIYIDMPFQGGRILSRAIEAGQVEANERNLRLLLQAWTAAREYDRAGQVIDRLAPMTGEGDLLIQKARLVMEQNDWRGTVEAAEAALELGNVSNPGAAWLMIGIARMELDQLRESRRAFQRAQEFDANTRRQAREWQRFVEDRIQLAELRAASR